MPFQDLLYSLQWWLAVTLAGLAAWPIAAWLLRGLPDKGLGLARTLGLLLVGYAFWALTVLGFTRNNAGGILVAFGLVAGLSAWAGTRFGWGRLGEWIRANWRLALGYEILFVAAFGLWAVVRAYNPPIMSAGGEKWMEYAFLNAIDRSSSFPPMDPWLSGYAISYYYFGYVIVAALAKVTGVPMSHGFNLGIALLFALTALGATGVAFNLIALVRPRGRLAGSEAREDGLGESQEARSESAPLAWRLFFPALLGFVLVLGIGNFEGVWEAVHAKGWGSPALWNWLDIHNLSDAPVTGSFRPDDNYWWWRASRTVNDRDWASGAHVEVIDEFPFFSFLLGDMHPHVLALPFAFLAMGLGLSLCLNPARGAVGGRALPLDPGRLALAMVILGGLSFLNTWDFPFYLFVVVAAYLLGRVRQEGWGMPAWLDAGRLALIVAVGGVLIYLPFYTGFSSQARGILPNVVFPTQWQQFATMFGPLLIVLAAFLGWALHARRRSVSWRLFGWTLFAVAAGLLLLSLMLGGLLLLVPSTRGLVQSAIPSGMDWGQALGVAVRLRFTQSVTAIALAAIIAAIAALLFVKPHEKDSHAPDPSPVEIPPMAFALVLAGTGALLALGPEFLYLHDGFGTRMNTVFKFYYQAWALWAAAGAFGVYYVFTCAGPLARRLTGVGLTLALALGFVYPALALPSKTNDFQAPSGPTLDSTAEFAQYNPDDYKAVQWVRANLKEGDVILEAVGGSYTGFGRVSAFSGVPALLGWPWHEVQWRGGMDEIGSRESDAQAIYTGRDWDSVDLLLDRYGIDYVVVGPLERSKYGPAVQRIFDQQLQKAYENASVTIYRRPEMEAAR